MGTTSFTRGESEQERELARLFREYLDAFEAGRDIGAELLTRAGPAHAELAAKIGVHRDLYALSRSFGAAPGTDAPQFLGRFRILESLGQGGLSRVLLAHDPELGRKVALKVLARDELPDQEKRAWVLNEARSLASLEHPGVVRVYEVGETAGHSFIAMELLVGPSLGDVIQEWRRVRAGSGDEPKSAEVRDLAARLATYSAKIELLAILAEALAHCHDHRVLHRDIKPPNVQFDAAGRPKLIDFGLAHMSDADEDSRIGLTASLVGTAAYIAPEQVSNDRTGADPHSDQFAFGTLAYECLTLENPFLRPTRRATLDAVEAAAAEPLRKREPALPPDLALVVHHALERRPELRYPSMAALAADLRAIQASRPISIRPPSLVHIGRLWFQRHRRGVLVASSAFALAAAAWTFTWGASALAQRSAVLQQLQAIHPESFSGPLEFTESFQPLLALKRQAEDFDAGLLRAGLWGGLTTEVQRTIDSWSRSLARTFARESKECEERGVPMQDRIYRELFGRDEILCPESPHNIENRVRGTVLIPREELEQGKHLFTLLTPLPGMFGSFSEFLETTLTEQLVPGFYRLQAWDQGAMTVRRAAYFYVGPGWSDQVRIELREPHGELLEHSVPFERTNYSFAGQDLAIGSFAILDGLVTVREFQEFLATAGTDEKRRDWPGPFQLNRHPDAPAMCSYEQALEFTAWAGGRLPTRRELTVAEASDLVDAREESLDASGEFLCDRIGNMFTWLQYSRRREKENSLVLSGLSEITGAMVEKVLTPPGFRVVFDLDEPEFYERVASRSFPKK